MKKILLAGAVALFGLSNAQIAKGTAYLLGEVGYSHKENSDYPDFEKSDIVRILPAAGYFVGTNLAIGAGIGYKSEVTHYDYDRGDANFSNRLEMRDTDNAFVIAPFVRKYWTLSEKLYIFGQLQVPLEFGYEKFDRRNSSNIGGPFFDYSFSKKNNYTSIGVNIKPGFDYFLNRNWSIEATVGEFGYNRYKKDLEGARSRNNYKFGLNLSSVTFGVKYILTK